MIYQDACYQVVWVFYVISTYTDTSSCPFLSLWRYAQRLVYLFGLLVLWNKRPQNRRRKTASLQILPSVSKRTIDWMTLSYQLRLELSVCYLSWTAHATITGIPIPQAWSLVKNRSWFAWFRGQEAQAQMPEIFMPVEGLFPLCSHGMEGQRAENRTVLCSCMVKEKKIENLLCIPPLKRSPTLPWEGCALMRQSLLEFSLSTAITLEVLFQHIL